MSTTERAREIAETAERAVAAYFAEVPYDRYWPGRVTQAMLNLRAALAAPVVPEPPTWSHRVDSDCEDEFLTGVGCIVCEVKQLHAALAFTRQVAAMKRCEDEPDTCRLDSGPCCATHDYFVDSVIEDARAALQRVKQA